MTGVAGVAGADGCDHGVGDLIEGLCVPRFRAGWPRSGPADRLPRGISRTGGPNGVSTGSPDQSRRRRHAARAAGPSPAAGASPLARSRWVARLDGTRCATGTGTRGRPTRRQPPSANRTPPSASAQGGRVYRRASRGSAAVSRPEVPPPAVTRVALPNASSSSQVSPRPASAPAWTRVAQDRGEGGPPAANSLVTSCASSGDRRCAWACSTCTPATTRRR